MDVLDCAIETKGDAGMCKEKLAAAAESMEVNDLFAILAEAEREHHDALVELRGKVGPQRPQLRLVRGGACLFKTSPGKA